VASGPAYLSRDRERVLDRLSRALSRSRSRSRSRRSSRRGDWLRRRGLGVTGVARDVMREGACHQLTLPMSCHQKGAQTLPANQNKCAACILIAGLVLTGRIAARIGQRIQSPAAPLLLRGVASMLIQCPPLVGQRLPIPIHTLGDSSGCVDDGPGALAAGRSTMPISLAFDSVSWTICWYMVCRTCRCAAASRSLAAEPSPVPPPLSTHTATPF
jgi:hypothetical protein